MAREKGSKRNRPREQSIGTALEDIRQGHCDLQTTK